MGHEIELRACCGRLRFALLDVIESLPAGARIHAMRWGPTEIPLDVEVGAGAATQVAETILDTAERWLGSSTSCYTGRGVLVIA